MRIPNLKLKLNCKKFEESNEAIVFAKISSHDQEQAEHYLEAQIHSMGEYCKKYNFTIIWEIKIIESAIKEEHSELKKIIEFILEQKSRINLVFYSVEMFNQDLQSISTLLDLVKEGKIICHYFKENVVLNKDLHVCFHLINTIIIGRRVKYTFNQKRREGTILGPAPIGYLNLPRVSNQNRAAIGLDPERAYIIKKMFEDYATGLKSIEDIKREVEKKGLRSARNGEKLGKSQIGKILSNPFYCGFMKSKGNIYPHVYEKLITKEMFDKCQDIRLKKRNKRYKRTVFPFLYRGLLTCSHCGCSYSPDKKKDKYVYMYPRLKKDCPTCCNIREEVISEQLEEVMQQIYIPEEILEKIKICLEEIFNEQNHVSNKALVALKAKYQTLEENRQRALHAFMDSSITKDEYHPLVQFIKEEKFLIEEKIYELNETSDSFEDQVISVFELAHKSYELFKASEVEDRRRIINLLFQKLQMDGKKLVFSLQNPLDGWIKKGNVQSDYPNCSHS